MRKKVAFDMLTKKRIGINWVNSLPNYMKCVNNEKRKALGWQSPFEIYFGRKSNEIIKCGVPEHKCYPEIWNSFQTNRQRYEKIHETSFQIKEKST